jgi:membrane-associated phospholipid phosphatase
MNPHTDPDVSEQRAGDEGARRTSPVMTSLVVAIALAALFVAWTWFIAGPLKGVRIDRMLNRDYEIRPYVDVLHVLDRIGQRAVALPILGVVAAAVGWRHRSMRPVLISVSAVVAVNLCVLILKLWLGRGAPVDHKPRFFIDGQAYPSGHSSNVIAVYGTAAYLIWRYTAANRRVRIALVVIVTVLSIVMTVTSTLLRWHWFGDLIAGFLVGGVVLAATVAVDLAVPFQSNRPGSPSEGSATPQHPT